jgi:hypothetical protein
MREMERECGTGAMADNFSVPSSDFYSHFDIVKQKKKKKKATKILLHYRAYSNLCRSKLVNSISSFGPFLLLQF